MGINKHKQGFLGWSLRMLMWASLGFVVLVFAFEWHNPLGLRYSPGKPNQVKSYRMKMLGGVLKQQVQTFNNIGCLGENYSDTITRPKVFFIGSSTTLNSMVPWDSQWSAQAMHGLPYWFNNAGVDGSGVGYWMKMLQSISAYSPNYIVVLYAPRKSKSSASPESTHWPMLNKLKELAFVQSVLIPYAYSLRANKKQEGYAVVDWRRLPSAKDSAEAIDTAYIQHSLKEAELLIDSIQAIGAIPVFIAQPTPFGNYEEDGIRVGNLALAPKEIALHTALAQGLQAICASRGMPFINGEQFPKTFRNYLDLSHFNEAGNKAFGAFIRDSLQAILAKKFPVK
ncbi:MAG: hypothetical protein FGM54_08730 [Chitinophagaceae bacterium]|nr:hypothetical protein [Chitinophagaceae bacterium]